MSAAAPPPLRISTAALPPGAPPRRRQAYWEEAITGIFPISLEPSAAHAETFSAEAVAVAMGGVLFADVVCGRQFAHRTAADIARRPLGAYFLFEQQGREGSVLESWGGRRGGRLEAGDMFLGHADETFFSDTRDRHDHRIWLLPAALVEPFLPDPGRVQPGLRLEGRNPGNALLKTYVAGLAKMAPVLAPDAAAQFAANVGRMAAIAAGAEARGIEGGREAVHDARLARVKALIEQRLRDPLLTPARAAKACGLSARTVHALFRPSETSFGAYVTQRRLEEARALIVTAPARPIAAIAYELGFNSLATFYRNYRERFGEAPGDTRERTGG